MYGNTTKLIAMKTFSSNKCLVTSVLSVLIPGSGAQLFQKCLIAYKTINGCIARYVLCAGLGVTSAIVKRQV